MDINLFKNDNGEVALPSIEIQQSDEQAKLMSDNIASELSKPTIKTIRIKEDIEIDPLNFVIDLSCVDTVTVLQKDVLKSLISSSGDASIYLYKKQGLIKIGVGKRFELERLFPIIKNAVFNDEIKVYKNLNKGGEIEEINTKDITNYRLNL